jgi:hypothetical protein
MKLASALGLTGAAGAAAPAAKAGAQSSQVELRGTTLEVSSRFKSFIFGTGGYDYPEEFEAKLKKGAKVFVKVGKQHSQPGKFSDIEADLEVRVRGKQISDHCIIAHQVVVYIPDYGY